MTSPHGEKIGAFQILLVALSIYVLFALAIEVIVPISSSTRLIFAYVDNLICLVFLYDFFHRLAVSKNKLHFLRWGWIDLISSIPTLSVFRVGRAVRIIRVLRLLRGFRSVKTIGAVLFANRAKGAVATAAFLCILLIIFSSVAILHVENTPDSNIHGPQDALWWSIVTITTVGYGDRFPTTFEGRIIGVVLMLSGVGLFGVLSGAFAAWFTGTLHDENESEVKELSGNELSVLIEEVRALRTEMRESISAMRGE